MLASLFTVAVNCCVTPTGTLALAGEIETVIPEIVTAADADMFGSAAEVATTLTLEFAGMLAGAV